MSDTNGLAVRPRSAPFEAFGKIQSFEIILDRHDGPNGVGVYSPGDLLSGHVRLELSQRLTVNNIDLLVQGTGNVGWRMRSLQGDEVVSDDEVYLNEIAELVGKRNNEMVTLSAGEHIFPFACDLPWELPATFTGSHGNVSYLVKVVVRADRNESIHLEPCIATNIFLVESRLPLEGAAAAGQLNSYRIDYKHPVKTSGLTTGSSAVKVSLFMPRRAFDIGDTIVVNLDLTNTSKRAAKNMGMALVMEATYHANGRAISERMLIVDHEDDFVVRHMQSRQWRHVGLIVPRFIPPSGKLHSKLIEIKYWIVFKAELDRTQDYVLLQTPILIGLQLPDEMKFDHADGSVAAESMPPADDGASGRQPSSRILYQGTREPRVDYHTGRASGTSGSTSRQALQRPLYVDVQKPEPQREPPKKQQKQHQQQKQQQQQQQQQHMLQPPLPQTQYQPFSEQQQQPPASPRGDADSQVISMRFTDELDERSPYGQSHKQQQQQQHKANVSRNPLFVPDDEANNGTGEAPGASGSGGSYQAGVHERRLDSGQTGNDDHVLTATFDASMGNDADEVLY